MVGFDFVDDDFVQGLILELLFEVGLYFVYDDFDQGLILVVLFVVDFVDNDCDQDSILVHLFDGDAEPDPGLFLVLLLVLDLSVVEFDFADEFFLGNLFFAVIDFCFFL